MFRFQWQTTEGREQYQCPGIMGRMGTGPPGLEEPTMNRVQDKMYLFLEIARGEVVRRIACGGARQRKTNRQDSNSYTQYNHCFLL